jgi:hypothetical protein
MDLDAMVVAGIQSIFDVGCPLFIRKFQEQPIAKYPAYTFRVGNDKASLLDGQFLLEAVS